MSPRVSVVIPNWNGLTDLPGCLQTLGAQSFTDFEVIIVDNASTDGSLSWVREHYPHLLILERRDNGGFSKAVNLGIRASSAEYVVLLNNDTAVDERCLESLVRALDGRQDYDLAAPMMLLYHDPGLLNAAGDVYSVRGLQGKNRGFGRPSSEFGRAERVLGACAGAAIYRRALFDQVGLFDEDFFLTSEDTDFNIRCLIAGKRCLYVPEARVMHKVGVSRAGSPGREVELLMLRNMALVAAKDLPVMFLLYGVTLFVWRFLRQSLPLRPSYWRRSPMPAPRSGERFRAEVGGLRLGWSKRPAVWRLRATNRAEIRRWLLNGVGPA